MEKKSLDETLQPYVEKALEKLEQGAGFAMDQLPDLVQEFYMWHTASWLFWTILWTAVGLGLWFGGKTMWKKGEEWDPKGYGDDTGYAMQVLSVFMRVGGLAAIFGIVECLHELIYILAAPKLYLLDYFIG